MRGSQPIQTGMFSYVSTESRIPATHPLRRIKVLTDKALCRLSRDFNAVYSRIGRPSIPPEWLLKAQILMALFSIRSDRLFCETLGYNILFRWFLDMDLDTPAFEHSVFSKNRERLMEQEVAHRLLQQVIALARKGELLSDEHFTVDGTLIEAWASMKSFKRRDGGSDGNADDTEAGNPTVNFRGERLSNLTHASTTDPEARLARKNKRVGAQLCYGGHVLMENRSGMCVDIMVSQASGTAEREAALEMIKRERRRGRGRIRTVGADKGYCAGAFIHPLQSLGVKPHVAWNEYAPIKGYEQSITRQRGYNCSQRMRKRIEEIFGWFKTIGGLRKTRFKGVKTNQAFAYVVAAAYNLLRMAKLTIEPAVAM
jgi:transposase